MGGQGPQRGRVVIVGAEHSAVRGSGGFFVIGRECGEWVAGPPLLRGKTSDLTVATSSKVGSERAGWLFVCVLEWLQI